MEVLEALWKGDRPLARSRQSRCASAARTPEILVAVGHGDYLEDRRLLNVEPLCQSFVQVQEVPVAAWESGRP